MTEKLSQINISEIKRKRKDSINKIRLHIDKLEILEEQEKEYRERKKLLNLKQNRKRKAERKNVKEQKENNKYF